MLRCRMTVIASSAPPLTDPARPSPLTDVIRAALRRAGPADAAAARNLVREAYARWVPTIGREPRPMTADYDEAVRNHALDLLELDGTIAALIEMRPEADHLLIVNVAVSPSYQGCGYGRTLMAHAEEHARSLGLSEIRLYTNSRFTENVKLYERIGYRVDREEALPPLGMIIHMSKRLQDRVNSQGSDIQPSISVTGTRRTVASISRDLAQGDRPA